MTEDVKFNGQSVAGFGCIMTGVTIGKAQPRITSVVIPGMDGVLDTSLSIDGKLHYDNRQITITLRCVKCGKADWLRTLFSISGAVDAQICTVVFEKTPELMFVGRVSVEDFDGRSAEQEITITIDAEPATYTMPRFDVNPMTGRLEMYSDRSGYPVFAMEGTDLVVYQNNEAAEPIHSLNFANITLSENNIEARW